MGDSLGTPGVAGMGSDLDAALRRVDSVESATTGMYYVVCCIIKLTTS